MTKPILIDMDGVFCDFVRGFYDLARVKFPYVWKHLPKKDEIETFYIEDSIKDDKAKKIAEQIILDPSLFHMFPPIEGAIQGMNLLQYLAEQIGTNVFICTAPHCANKESYKAKAEWIDSFLGRDWLERTLIVRDKTACNGVILIDDKPIVSGRFTPTWEHVLFKQSYNTPTEHTMHDWSDDSVNKVIEYALKLM